MKPRILIVEDEPAVSTSIQKYLEIVGYTSKMAGGSDEAKKKLDATGFDLVIVDIKLKHESGLDLTELIIKKYGVDVIVMTSYSGTFSYEDAISRGASDLVFKPIRYEELVLRIKRVLKERVMYKESVDMMEKLKKLAITDGLTKLYNSRHFYSQLTLELGRSNRYNHPLGLLLLDIDHFKVFNDSYGHLEGDKVLVQLGKSIKTCLRRMDSAYRYGGEEFTVILPETGAAEALAAAQRISEAVAAKKFKPNDGNPVSITVSTGVTEYHPKEKVATFVNRADKAMYLSKQNGRNRISTLFVDNSEPAAADPDQCR